MKELILLLIGLMLNPIIFIPLSAAFAVWAVRMIASLVVYYRSSYYKVTHLHYHSAMNDLGRYGEYLTCRCLHKYERRGAKLLFNLYLPKGEDETSEIDVLMICKKGIFVFESKNYSGWIFGKENGFYWYQTLPRGRRRSCKERFYNPIMQNRTHIKCLSEIVGDSVPLMSVVVFSERCTLKNVWVYGSTPVVKRNDLCHTVDEICRRAPDCLSADGIGRIYSDLYTYTQVGADVKKRHIENIHASVFEHSPAGTSEQFPQPETEEAVTAGEDPIDICQESEPAASGSAEEVAPAAAAEPVAEPSAEKPVAESTEEPSAAPAAEKSEPPKCPFCGGTLVIRTAKRGQNIGQTFYGCSNFPKCRYTRKIDRKMGE